MLHHHSPFIIHRSQFRGGHAGMRPKHLHNVPFFLLGVIALVAAGWAGLIRLGWDFSPIQPRLPIAHGPLMISGFLGTVISLERAVALRTRWAYTAPLLSGAGALVLLVGIPGWPGPLLMAGASAVLVGVFAHIIRRHTKLHTLLMGIGAVTWGVGNLLWLLEWPIYAAVPWWAGFLVLTIVGERVELSRMHRTSESAHGEMYVAAGIFLAGLLVSAFNFDAGMRLTGVGMVALAVWLLRHDITKRTIRQSGVVRYIAACLLSGYVWLAISGVLALRYGGVIAGPYYDAVLHAVFLGFVFTMIFGHAPIILPAVLGVAVSYSPRFYLHLGLLHVSLALRVVGDIVGWFPGRQWGGMFNVVALLLFIGSTVYAVARPTPAANRHRRVVVR